MTRKPSPLLIAISLIGAGSFLYPFFLPTLAGVGAQTARGGIEVQLVFTALGLACLVVLVLAVQQRAGGGDHGASKLVALLGMLVAIDATLRLVPSLLGASSIFLLILLTGFAFGAEFGFLMGALTLLVSAIITGGLGPWLPYQMLGAGWVGMTAGWLPRAGESGGRRELLLLAALGGIWGFLYGAILNLMNWPYAAPGLQEQAGLYWVPGMSAAETLSTYLRFYITTSLVYDAFRAGANILLVLVLGGPLLRLLDRYRDRFRWTPWTNLEPDDRPHMTGGTPLGNHPPSPGIDSAESGLMRGCADAGGRGAGAALAGELPKGGPSRRHTDRPRVSGYRRRKMALLSPPPISPFVILRRQPKDLWLDALVLMRGRWGGSRCPSATWSAW